MDKITEKKWQERVKSLLKAELKRKNVTYAQLSIKLNEIGVNEKPENITLKMSRGKFSAIFLLQCLSVIGVTNIRLD